MRFDSGSQRQNTTLDWFACGSVGQDFEIDTGAYSQLDARRNGLKEMFL